MGGRAKLAIAVAVALTLATALGACGGSSGSAQTEGSKSAEASKGSTSKKTEASRQFITKGGNNEIPKFGKEADAEERELVSSIVEENLKARAAGDWAGQCSSLAVSVIKTLEKTASPLTGQSCAKALEAEAAKVPRYLLANNMTGPIAALRIGGKSGYALYHGTEGVDYAMPMTNEGGEWKVGALLPIKLG
jgi:hypothetical protein